MDLNESLNALRVELIELYREKREVLRYQRENRVLLLKRIEVLTLNVIKTIARNEFPFFWSINRKNFQNYQFDGRVRERSSMMSKITFARANGRAKFAAIMLLLSKIHKLLSSGRTSTKRELYYENVDSFRSQDEVKVAMLDVSYILKAPAWELGVLSTAKGMIAGPLLLKTDDGLVTDCAKPGGVLIPQNITDVELVSGCLKWALLIEKDAAFQKILDSNALVKMKDCLLITGKGYPDASTRLLVRRLWETFKIPILALVDADPHGIEIMCIYRFGSMASAPFADHLACPSVRWLGVHPSDLKLLAAEILPLSSQDVRKLTLLSDRTYIKNSEKLNAEIQILLKDKAKAEIEGISRVSTNYITDVYIPSKIRCREYF